MTTQVVETTVIEISELEKLLQDLEARREVMVLPIINGLEIFVDYRKGKINEIYQMVHSDKVTLIGKEWLDEVLGNNTDGIKLARQRFNEVTAKLGLPSELEYTCDGQQDITFMGYMYIPEAIYKKINSARASAGMQQYASIKDLCTRIMYGEKAIEFEALDSLSVVLNDFSSKWKAGKWSLMKSDPTNWNDSLELFKRDNIPFAPGQMYYTKSDLLEAAADRNPYNEKEYDLPYEVIGINININRFGVFDGIDSYSHFYKYKPIRAIIDNVIWEMTGSGKLLPYATYLEDGVDREGKPIKVTRRIYLYSPRYIIDNDIRQILRMGDEVFVGKGPDGLRYIQKINYKARNDMDDSFDLFDIPDDCPYCHQRVVDFDQSIDGHLYCQNPYCIERIMLVTIALSRSILLQDHRYKLIKSFDTMKTKIMAVRTKYPDLFEGPDADEAEGTLPYSVMMPVPRILEFDNREFKIKNISLAVFLRGLEINGLTEEYAQAIAAKFKNVDELRYAFLADLESIKGLPSHIAREVYSVVTDPFYVNIIEAMGPYLEDRADKVELTKNEEHDKERDAHLRKTFLNRVVAFDGDNFEHYREIVDFLTKFGAFIVDSSIDPTNGDTYMAYTRMDGGRRERVEIDLSSDKARERLQYLITAGNTSRLVIDADLNNARITDRFRDSDDPEKLLSLLIIIMSEEDMMVMINNYNKPKE